MEAGNIGVCAFSATSGVASPMRSTTTLIEDRGTSARLSAPVTEAGNCSATGVCAWRRSLRASAGAAKASAMPATSAHAVSHRTLRPRAGAGLEADWADWADWAEWADAVDEAVDEEDGADRSDAQR